MKSIKYKYSQARESRLIAGLVIFIFGLGISFFSTLVALESFSSNPLGISIFLILGVSMLLTGLFFSMCTPIMEFDKEMKVALIGHSCILFKSKKMIAFSSIKEVGIKELYHAGDKGEEAGTTFHVEIRTQGNIEVPGTKQRDFEESVYTAKEIAEYINVTYNGVTRKPFTGSFKLK